MKKTYEVKATFGTYNCFIEVGKYCYTDSVALQLVDPNEGPVGTITVCLPGYEIGSDEAFIDINNCPWAPAFIEENGLGEFTYYYGQSGYCDYPLYKFNMEVIE